MHKDSALPPLLKAVGLRFLGSLFTSLIAYQITHRGSIALAIGGIEFLAKIGFFFFQDGVGDRMRFGKKRMAPSVIWFTGLPCSGKTTLSVELMHELEKRDIQVSHLDGDSIREIFPQSGFTKADRDEHIRRIGFLAGKLQAHGIVVIASFVSPYRESRDFVRSICQNFVEIHVATPLEECEKRDVKGMYAKARAGQLSNFTGIDDPYEEPLNPELRVQTTGQNPHESLRQILEYLDSK